MRRPIDLELIFSDLEILERRIDKTKKLAKGDKSLEKEAAFLERLSAFLSEGNSARAFPLAEDERELMESLPLLSRKPVIYAANIAEEDLADGGASNPHFQALRALSEQQAAEILPICAEIEEELAAMEPEEKAAFLRSRHRAVGSRPAHHCELPPSGAYQLPYRRSEGGPGVDPSERGFAPRRRRERSIRILKGALSAPR